MPTAVLAVPVVATGGLSKKYPGAAEPVLGGVDLTVDRGEIFALLGPNGAGKTTTVEVLEGFRARSGGSVQVLGEDPAAPGRGWRARIGVVPQQTGAFDQLSVREVVSHFAALYPDPRPAEEAIGLVGLGEKARVRAGRLSGGQQRRLDIALGIVGRPELLFLDEPTTGLDPEARRRTWRTIRQLADEGCTVLLTTHYLDEVEALADRAAVLVGGRIAETGPPATLGGRSEGAARIEFRIEGLLTGAEPPPAADGTPLRPDGEGRVRITTTEPTVTLGALLTWAFGLGVRELPGLTVVRPSLEDVYLQMLGIDSPAEVAR